MGILYKQGVPWDSTMSRPWLTLSRWVSLALLGCATCSSKAVVPCPPDRPIRVAGGHCQAPALTPLAELSSTALIVTDAAYADGFARLARLHTLTGVPTQVITVQEICAASSTPCAAGDGGTCHDTVKAIKNYLAGRYQTGLRHVVLGGDLSIVPTRTTSDVYANVLLGLSYQRTFPTDHYFADLSDWDGNGDCVHGEPGADAPDYLPELALSRLPVSSLAELEAYLGKAQRYLTSYDTARVGTALFLSNVATQLTLAQALSVTVDSALYFESPERTLSLIPNGFSVSKLYSSLTDRDDVTPMSVPAELAAFAAGQNLVVHAGHGSAGSLTVEQDGSHAFLAAMAYGLRNTQYPIMLSCGCEAADVSAGDASAGRSFVTAPDGGGIGYLGNATVGLGMAGSLQLVDEVLRHAFVHPGVLVGEAVMRGRLALPTTDSFVFSGLPLVGSLAVPVIDDNAWRWTQKSATYLGDGLLPMYTDPALAPAPTFTVTAQRRGNFLTVDFLPSTPVSGTLTVALAGGIYQLVLAGDGRPVSVTVAQDAASVTYGFVSSGTLAVHAEAAL
jgi:hypothetical protein